MNKQHRPNHNTTAKSLFFFIQLDAKNSREKRQKD